ncbi:MAG: hypothetical protein GC137_04500 [Alphaproteobacteria bacterium]|nr:hypothetical protein [Alphaproteobacteria bacterium]
MREQFVFFSVLMFFGLVGITPVSAQQSLLADPSAKRQTVEDKKEFKNPVPRVFSSEVTSADEARRLDNVYDSLLETLWRYAASDFNLQAKLMELLAPSEFKKTRFSKEFEGPLENSMENLNRNFNALKKDIESANKVFQDVKLGIRKEEQDKVERLWNEKIKAFEDFAKTYFKSQEKFLNTYRNFVKFIIEQKGGYYYRRDRNDVSFYKNGAYRYYAQSMDTIKNIQHQQRQYLKAKPPANSRDLF